MNAVPDRLKLAIFIALTVCGIVFPLVLGYGIYGILSVVFAAAGLKFLIAAFRSRPDEHWETCKFRMSRLSRLVVGLWFVFFAANLVTHGLMKLPNPVFYFVIHAVFMILVVLSRWRDTGRFFK
jgi:hypothetical protein